MLRTSQISMGSYFKPPCILIAIISQLPFKSLSYHLVQKALASHLIPSQNALFKFVKVGAEQVTPHLFVQYLTFLRAISNTSQSARHCYNLLRSDSAYGSGNSLVTWDHFFGSLEQYLWHIHEQLEGELVGVSEEWNILDIGSIVKIGHVWKSKFAVSPSEL